MNGQNFECTESDLKQLSLKLRVDIVLIGAMECLYSGVPIIEILQHVCIVMERLKGGVTLNGRNYRFLVFIFNTVDNKGFLYPACAGGLF